MLSKNHVTMYTRPGCVMCTATARALRKKGLTFETADVSRDLQAAEALRSAGHQQLPVVMIQDDAHVVVDVWSGFRPDRISALASTVVATSEAVPA
ncbi:glutaredoxin family protein [Micrococcus terreus]|uniref:glutaredoxin domain-containing protein n=1 Tax=Micrococcus terreus TaxID=574650 RepID=UPI0021A5ED4A|nr:glutaredoxin domain-containing protein [Micrococcus terreus]MCT2088541.1 glutaredoxin family protein [Micrococcus terreus]